MALLCWWDHLRGPCRRAMNPSISATARVLLPGAPKAVGRPLEEGTAVVTTSPHQVGVLVFEGAKMLDVAGPSEVFAEACLSGADYRISMLSADGNDVRTSIGMRIPV